MTLKRLLIVIAVLAVIAGGGISWLSWYAYTPQGKARTIIAQYRGDTSGLRHWLMKHGHVSAQELAGLGDKRALEPLLDQLKFPPNYEQRPQAAEALGILGDPRAIPTLKTYLKDDSPVRPAAAKALEKLGVKNPFGLQTDDEN